MNFTKQQAISSLLPKAFFTTVGDEVTWLSPELTQPTEAEINAEQARLQAEYDAQEYARDRQEEYPSIGDQLDMLWHAIDGDATLKSDYADFHTAIKTVKDANPK